jgi:hypothetical protein
MTADEMIEIMRRMNLAHTQLARMSAERITLAHEKHVAAVGWFQFCVIRCKAILIGAGITPRLLPPNR